MHFNTFHILFLFVNKQDIKIMIFSSNIPTCQSLSVCQQMIKQEVAICHAWIRGRSCDAHHAQYGKS